MKMKNIKPTLVLGVICLASALLLAVINMFTAPIIERIQNEKATAALAEVLPGGSNFRELVIEEGKYPAAIKGGYSADGGFVFRAEVAGKDKGLTIMIGIDEEGKVTGTKVIASAETPSYSAGVFSAVEGTEGAYFGMDLASFSPYLVSGATLTSAAYGEAVKAALQSFGVANGQDVDIRTPEQILQDNCNAALGTEGAAFTKWFRVEVIEGIDAVYLCDKGGVVYQVGETFVGVTAEGEIATAEVSEALAGTVKTAHDIVTSSKRTVLETLPEGVHKNIKKVTVTESGNYELEVLAEGFSVHEYEDYSYGDNVPMMIRVSISADGKIIDCLTVSHGESKGYGDKCATEEYYESWRGVDADLVKVGNSGDKPGVISGATYTAEGYQRAIKRAFDAFKILTGGEEQ